MFVLFGREYFKEKKKMYRLSIESTFDAAHKLIGYQGKCANLHGHTWKVEVFVLGKELNEQGFLVDFSLLKKKLEEIVSLLDHRFLNEIKEIGNPTAENIAKYVFLNYKIQNGVTLEKVRVWESSKSWCEYYEC